MDQTRRMRILRAMTGKGPMTFSEICTAIGDEAQRSSTNTVLTTLVIERLLVKPTYGVYECVWKPAEEVPRLPLRDLEAMEPVKPDEQRPAIPKSGAGVATDGHALRYELC
jgi:hypothetical protein